MFMLNYFCFFQWFKASSAQNKSCKDFKTIVYIAYEWHNVCLDTYKQRQNVNIYAWLIGFRIKSLNSEWKREPVDSEAVGEQTLPCVGFCSGSVFASASSK